MPMGAGTRVYQRMPGRSYSHAGLHGPDPNAAPVLPPGQNFASREDFLAQQQGYHDQQRQRYTDAWGSDEGWAQFDPTRGTFGDWAKGSERHGARTGARDAYYDYIMRQGGTGAPVSQEDAMAYAMNQIGAPGGGLPAGDPALGADPALRQGGDRIGGQQGSLQEALMANMGMGVDPAAMQSAMQGAGKGGFDMSRLPQGNPSMAAAQSQGGKGGGGGQAGAGMRPALGAGQQARTASLR